MRTCRPDWVIDQTFDLFVELGANDDQCDFPVVYASGVNGIAGDTVEDMSETLEPLFEAVVREVHYITLGFREDLNKVCHAVEVLEALEQAQGI